MTIELAPEAEAALALIASTSCFSRDELLTRAVESYASRIAYEDEKVAHARADIGAGRVLSHEEVFRRLDAEFADHEAHVD